MMFATNIIVFQRPLEFIQSTGGRVLFAHALALAELIAGQLKQLTQLKIIECAGSLRRCCETVGDIDLLVEAQDGKTIIETFTQLPGVQEVRAAGETKGSVLFADTNICPEVVQVDLRVVPAESMGVAWQYFTGSKYHNVRLREIAVKKKFKLNEYGLCRGEKQIAGKEESAIYNKLGLVYIEPTLREDRGEIELAQKNELPSIIQLADIRGDLHMHSPASDGRVEIEDLITAAKRLGYKYIAITDHSQSSVIANGLDAKRLLVHASRIKKINQSLDDFTVLASAEVDILMDGSLDYPDDVLAELDFVIASVHSGMNGPSERNTQRLLGVMENPYVNCIGHPTGRMINVREPMQLDMDAIINQAAKTNTAMEVSASPIRLDLNDIHCRLAVEAGAKLIINTDAHDTLGLCQMHFGVVTAQRGWVTKNDVINCQTINNIKKWIQQKRDNMK